MVLWVAAGVVLPTWAATAQAQMALSAAINVSGSFRALSQRMAKAYCQQHLQVMPLAALDVLAKVRKQAQAGAADLAKGSTAGAWPADLSRQLEEVQKQYTVLNTLTATAPSKASAAAVAEQADRMMTAAQTATESLEKLARAPSAKLVGMAGRQRMLSQRMAKQYFLLAAGVDPKASQTQMNADAAEFKQALQALAAAPVSTPAIRAELELGQAQWLFFEAAMRRHPDTKGMEAVATTSERLLEVMDRLTSLYDAALREVQSLTAEAEVGKIYRATVTGIKDFGCFAEFLPGQEGLVHISELADFRVNRTEDVVKMGEEIWVKVLSVEETIEYLRR